MSLFRSALYIYFFYLRLQRERQQQAQANVVSPLHEETKQYSLKGMIAHREGDSEIQNSIPETLPKAVPGTPLPGKKNWVVGKFGRVLPVMYLRRRDRKKIAKFDPSKTTHCLKKIKSEERDSTIAELTWNLQSEDEILNVSSGSLLAEKGKDRNESKSVVTVKERELSNDSFEEQALTEDVRTESSDSYSEGNMTWKSVKTKSSKKVTDDTLEGSKFVENGHSEESLRSVPQLEQKMLSQLSGEEGFSSKKTERKNRILDSSRHSSIHNGTCSSEVEREEKHAPDGTGAEAVEMRSFDSSDYTSGTESTDSESVSPTSKDLNSLSINSKSRSISQNSGNCDSKGTPRRSTKPVVTDSPQKRTNSNEKRLDALLERKKTAQAQKNVINDALKGLDSGPQSHVGGNHIVFSDSDKNETDDKEVKKAAYSMGDKVSDY